MLPGPAMRLGLPAAAALLARCFAMQRTVTARRGAPRRARLAAARRSLRPALTPAQWLAGAALLALHAAVAWRVCFVSYGWPALLASPGLAWTAPLLAWLLLARRRAAAAARRRGGAHGGGSQPLSPHAWPAALLPELPPGSAKNR